jgi:hypothetical protein
MVKQSSVEAGMTAILILPHAKDAKLAKEEK